MVVKIDESLKKALKLYAIKENMTSKKLVTRIIEDYLHKQRFSELDRLIKEMESEQQKKGK
jgi:hypothetical protein